MDSQSSRTFSARRAWFRIVALGVFTVALTAHGQTFVTEYAEVDLGRIGPTGMALDTVGGDKILYVSDQNHGRILKFNLTAGARVGVWGQTGTADGEFNSPFGIAIDPVSHDLYIAERGSNRISRITNTGTFVMKWGGGGTGPGQFNGPLGIAADATGNVYVTDHNNNRVQKFAVRSTAAGWQAEPVATWGGPGAGPGQFNGPYGITLDATGTLWVADGFNHRIQKFDTNGNYLGSIGTFGTGDGQFITPTWVNFDPSGGYYITETNSDPTNLQAADLANQRVQRFDASGAFVTKWGTFGEKGGEFRLPFCAVSDGTNIYVSDYYNTRIQKFTVSGATPPANPPPTNPPTGGTLAARFVNLSSRLSTTDGSTSRAFIAGFVVSGTAPKSMLVRAVGPGLAQFGVSGTLANPRIQILSGSTVVADNDDWINDATMHATCDRVGAFQLASGSHDAALMVTLQPGSYSAHVLANGGDGVALVEVYDAESGQPAAQLINLSTRGFVDTGDAVLVAGFVVNGDTPKRVLIRGVGPALGAFGVDGALSDAQLKIFRGETLMAENDDWATPQVSGSLAAASGADIAAAATATGAFALVSGSKDAAVLVTLPPGAYSAVVNGKNGTTGAGLVEVYEVPAR